MWGDCPMSDFPSLAGQPVTLENCWTFILNQPKISEEFVCCFLKQLLQLYLELSPSSEEVEDYLNQFSEVSELASAEQFEHWLEIHDDDYDSFMERIRAAISMKKFCSQIDSYKEIKATFEARKDQFDYFVLSRLLFSDQATATMACDQIKNQQGSFQEVFQTYAISNKVMLRGWKEAFLRADLPDEIQSLLLAQPKSWVSYLVNHVIDQPLKVNQGWYLIYIHQYIPAC
jgi:hypothetical protein